MTWRRLLGILGQIIALGAGVWFLVRTARGSWGTLALADLTPTWTPILLGSVLTAATYLYLVFVWVASLRWWGQQLGYLHAARIMFLTNLARFIPGMVWQLAGVAAMAHARAVSPLAATGGALLLQVVLLVTGLAVAAAWAPALLGHWVVVAPPGGLLGLTLMSMVIVVLALPPAIPFFSRLAGRVLRRPMEWPAPPRRAFAWYVVGLCLPWVTYGISFWLFGRGLLGEQAPGFSLAVGAFVASYVAGLIVVFAPSGLVVREAALVATLTPAVGGGAALVLALGSRLWLLIVELATALGVITVHSIVYRTPQGPAGTRAGR